MKNKINTIRNIIFWSWNVIFILAALFCLIEFLPPLITYGLLSETINKDFIAFFVAVFLVPIISVRLGYAYLRKDSKKLLQLMYCIELPLLVLTLFRIIFLRDLTLVAGFFLALFALSSLYLAYRLFSEKPKNPYANLIGATSYLWCGIWIFLLLSVFIPPLAYVVSKTLLSAVGFFYSIVSDIISHPADFFHFRPFFTIFFLFGGIFFIYTAALFVPFPIIYIYYSFKNWKAAFSQFPKLDKMKAGIVSALTAVMITTLLTQLSHQNHDAILYRLQSASKTYDDKRQISENEEYYRKALRDIYLAPYRYLDDNARANLIQTFYYETFYSEADLVKDQYNFYKWSSRIQTFFNNIASPFIYRGTPNGMAADRKLAEKLYNNLFDASIQEDERESIRQAVQATYSFEQIEAGLININEKKVHLDKQELTLKEQGEWADAEIHEVYFNPSLRSEEVFLHLKLPQGAVITGLWLSDDETKKFPAAIAPRGAAQKVYKEIVRQGADPSLLEQVGPQLYRLRVFPIPVNDGRYYKNRVMHMWLSLRLLKQSDTAWQMPLLTEKRSLYWDKNTKFILNGVQQAKGEEWLPAEIAVKQPSSPIQASVSLGNKVVEMQPFDGKNLNAECSLAVIVDTSFSMQAKKAEILNAKESIDKICADKGVDYYLWNDGLFYTHGNVFEAQLKRQVAGQTLGEQMFWGTFDSGDLASKFLPPKNNKKAVIVITDKTFFRENENPSDYSTINKPTWFLLVDRHYARSINDNLLKRLYEVGGGVETKLEDVFSSIAHHEFKAAHKDVIDVDQRYVWKLSQNKKEGIKNDLAKPLMAHELILHSIETGLTKNEKELDHLHKIALQSHIVSPYSSMIVLVNDDQKTMLAEAEKEKERFDRKVETGVELLTSPQPALSATAVPEPEEWALIIVTFSFLLLHLYRKGFGPERILGIVVRRPRFKSSSVVKDE